MFPNTSSILPVIQSFQDFILHENVDMLKNWSRNSLFFNFIWAFNISLPKLTFHLKNNNKSLFESSQISKI